jgi:2-phospho-L-lactate/phosphoenolpyruvate guanylyltransferase
MRTAAILPVKRFAQAKQRLGASVADPLRLELARAMVADVLHALEQAQSIECTIVVTGEPSVALAACEQGAIVIEDELGSGQSVAAGLGVARAVEEGFERVLCVPGDCPALDPAELDALLAGAPDRHPGSAPAPGLRAGAYGVGARRAGAEVVIVPDRHGSGTNGLLLTPPDAISPAFGPGSCERHHALARAEGVACRLERPASLLLDIDTGADLAALRERIAESGAHAQRTRAVLGHQERSNVQPIATKA